MDSAPPTDSLGSYTYTGPDRSEDPIVCAGCDDRPCGCDTAASNPGMNLAQAMGQLIGCYRRDRGMSRRELSRAIGFDPSAVPNMERGARLPSMRALYLIASVLKTDVRNLLPSAAPCWGCGEVALVCDHGVCKGCAATCADHPAALEVRT